MTPFNKLNTQMTQRSRRIWVATACIDILLLTFLAVSRAVELHVVVLIGVVPILIAFRLSRAQPSSLPGKRLDERQLSIKHRAYVLAYRVSFAVAILAALSLYSMKVYTGAAFWSLFYGYFVLLITLPTMATAWLEPDPLPEDTFHQVQDGGLVQ